MIRIARIAAMLAAGCGLVLSAAEVGQSAPTQSRAALILGQVVDGSTDRPMGGVVVTLNVSAATPMPPPTVPGTSRSSRSAIADANGKFVFNELPAGMYSFSLSTASGSLIGGYGMRRPGGTTQPFELAEGQRTGDVTLRAWRYGAVAGIVVDQDAEPIVETRVTLLRVETVAGHRRFRTGPTTMTDDRGMYRIPRVEPGEYTAYLPYTQVTVPLDVQTTYDSAASKGQASRLEFERTYGVDSSGAGGSGLRIGDHLLVRASNSYGATGQTGASFLSPPPDANGRVSVYPMTFYPGVTSLSEATPFTVESGQDRAGTDVQVRLVPAVQISGRVIGTDGPAQMVTIRLIAQSTTDADNESGMETARTVSNAAGDFTFLGVPSGAYSLRVARLPNTTRPTTMTSVTVGGTTTMSIVDDSNLPPLPLPDAPTENLAMPLAVGNQDIRNLTVQLQSGARLSGRVVYDGTSPPLTADQLVRVTVTLDPVDGRVFPGAAGKGQFETSGEFSTVGLLPGRYMLRLGGVTGPWFQDSVSIGDRSLPDQPLAIASTDVSGVVITLTDRSRSLSGSVRDARDGTPDPNATVLVFPANRALWVDTSANPRRFRSTRVSTRGTYQTGNFPAGDYVVVAIDDRFTVDWTRPQRLESLFRSGTRVTVGAAENKTLDLTTQVVR